MRKRYPLRDSPFYKLRGKGQLERLLGIHLEDIASLMSSYRVWVEDGREIQAPNGALAIVHKRIAGLMKRIELPDYVFSTKGRSHIDNAASHPGDVPLIKTDISKFYPSTSREMVLRLFIDDFLCASDVAHLCCYQGRFLPTGSPISGYVATLAAIPMFERVRRIASREGCAMSTYVDDIAISGTGAGLPMLLEVRKELRRAGFKTSNRKSRVYRAAEPKALTGAIITSLGLKLPNKQHRKIRKTRRDLAAALSAEEKAVLLARLKGQIDSAHQLMRHERAAPSILVER